MQTKTRATLTCHHRRLVREPRYAKATQNTKKKNAQGISLLAKPPIQRKQAPHLKNSLIKNAISNKKLIKPVVAYHQDHDYCSIIKMIGSN